MTKQDGKNGIIESKDIEAMSSSVSLNDWGVSVCVLTYNRLNVLRESLSSLRFIDYAPLEIIVVDNHSQDGTAQMVRTEFPEIRFYQMDGNEGVAARNIGIKMASSEIVITLDDDILGLKPEGIRSILSIFESRKDVGAICFKVVDYYTGEVCNWCHHYRKEEFCNREFLTDEITEGAVAFRKSALDKSSLYPEYFFISYEGPDLLVRMLNAGYKTIYSPKICVRHRTSPEGRKTWRRYYYDTRNQIWFVVRNYPIAWGIRFLLRGLTAMFFYSVRDGFLRYWVNGIVDGSKGVMKVSKDRRPISLETRNILMRIGSQRPDLRYMLKERLFKKGVRL